MDMIKAFQWLHILLGTLWVGGFVFTMFVVWPALLKRPVKEARALQTAIEKAAGPLFGFAAFTSILLGIMRGTWLGPLKSWESFSTPYGQTWMLALAIAIGFIIFGATVLRRMPQFVWNGDALHPKAVTRVRLAGISGLAAISLILYTMVRMHFGG